MIHLLTGGTDRFCKETTFGGEVIITDETGKEIENLPNGLDAVSCEVIPEEAKIKTYIGDVCYQVSSGDAEFILDLNGGTLSDGTTYTIELNDISNAQVDVNGNFYGFGDVLPDNTEFTITFSNPVNVEMLPATAIVGPSGGTVWHDVANYTPSTFITNGDSLTYTSGAVTLPLVNNGQNLTLAGTGYTGTGVLSDWGLITANNTTEIKMNYAAHDTYRYFVYTMAGEKKTAYGICDESNNVIYRDKKTNEIVDTSFITDCESQFFNLINCTEIAFCFTVTATGEKVDGARITCRDFEGKVVDRYGEDWLGNRFELTEITPSN